MQPPYQPNVVNQTVDFGGVTWKGNPGQGWSQQSFTGGNPIGPGGSDPMAMVKAAQQFQVQANQPSIQTLQGQQGSLSSAYSELLKSVLGQGSVAMNTATTGENTLLGQRGITNDSPLYAKEMTSAQLPVTATNESNAAQVGMGSAQDINQLAGQIAGLQAGNVPNALTYGGGISSLQLQAPLVAAQANQANFIPIPGVGVYNAQTGKMISSTGLSTSGRTIVGNF
jgi:hypothetical protein